MQEERRLFYVGATRAQDRLYFTWSRDMGGKRAKKVSPFLLEALDQLLRENKAIKLDPLQRISLFGGTGKMVATSKTKPKILKLSQAAIDDYETCAYKYRFVHILRLPILRHHAVVYGGALHEAVAAFYRTKMQGQKLSLNKLLEVFENTWISEGFLSAEHEEKRLAAGKKVLEEFWKREKDSKEIPTFVEHPFKFSFGDTIISGRFDRVDVNPPNSPAGEGGGEVKIIDFKSTENRDQERLEKDAKESIQLKVYALAYYKDSNSKKIPEYVGIYDLDTGLVGGYKPTKEMLGGTEKEILEVAENIRRNLDEDKFPANPKYFGRAPACTYCAYNSICSHSLTRK
jgi:DNA helicase-2/ATP-dependent DNA helicase PcrA